MKKRIVYRKNGKPVTVMIPQNARDLAELQKLYDRGELQAGDSVKGQGG